MKKNPISESGHLNPRVLLAFSLCSVAVLLAMLSFAATPPSGTIGPTGPTNTWVGPPTGGASANESTCVDGVNCDVYTLNVTGTTAAWATKLIFVKIAWTVPANDHDLYIHFDSNNNSVLDSTDPVVGSGTNGGAPQTEESGSIDPSATGTGRYFVHVVFFSVAPGDPYNGTATVQNKPTGGNANYIKGGISFSSNVTVKAPSAARDGEPSSRTDNKGNHYVMGIRGVPAGVDLWYFDLQPLSPSYDPLMRHAVYRGQPDSFTEDDATSVGADGGGDVDLAVGFADPATLATNNPPTVAASSLVAANISTQRSTDKGVTFMNNPLGNVTGGAPGDDRQWQEFYGKDKVYLLYRTLAPAVTMIQRSTDGGFTYGPAKTAGAIGQVGAIDVHEASGTVYISGSSGQVCVGTPPPFPAPAGSEPLTYTCNQAASDPNGVAHLFFSVKVADDGTPFGTAYVAYSNDKDIFLVHSQDKGATWSTPVRVSDGPETLTSIVPWMETGPTPGSVGITWYGTTATSNNDNADWNVFYAQSFNALADNPTFRQVKVSDHVIHGSNISEGGTLGNANRNLLDYFQISFDTRGAAVIDYTDDHNDFDGHTYVARQISGPSIKGGMVPAPIQGGGPFAPGLNPPPAQPGPNGEQVTDFSEDQTVGLLAEPGGTSPYDITSIRYSCEGTTDPVIVATMKVSNLVVVPPASNWRMNFTANAPNSKLSATGDYSFGLSDRGDQFFVRANTDTNPAGSFTYGTAVRNSDGTLSYTSRGNADSGAFNTTNNTITIKVAASKLNPFVTKGPAIGNGTVLAGLRGQAFTSGANGVRDLTRGGTQYKITCGAAPTPTATPTSTPRPMPTPTSTPTPSPSPSQCVEDNDEQMEFDNGWHGSDNSNATGGHYRYNAGQGSQPHGMRLNFRLNSDSGRVIYHYATSQNGGNADIYIDGTYVSTVSYRGNAGSTRSPIFGATRSFDVHNNGAHTFETRSRGDGEEFDDEVCVENGRSDDRPQRGPGETATSENIVPAAQTLSQNLLVSDSARALSVLADAGVDVPFRLIVVSPSGAIVGSTDASAGRAVVEASVSQPGLYVIQLVNVGVSPVNIWTAATPLVQR